MIIITGLILSIFVTVPILIFGAILAALNKNDEDK